MQRDEATLLDILQAARLAQEFTAGLDKDELLDDRLLQSSVLYQLVVLGEGVRRLSDAFRQANGEMPWRQIAGMRDHVVHGYDAVDLEEVWNTLKRDIPPLIAWLESHLAIEGTA
jgi:uncharacterized protein with HEPN domain